MKNAIPTLAAAGVALVALTGCELDDSKPSTVTESQPAAAAEYSPTRDTINGWTETWGQDPEKLSYVYIQMGDGVYGYFVMKGLPVSYCASINPPFEIDKAGAYNNDRLVVPAPGVDGAYYNGGGSCDTYYGFDAETGAYLEFTVGMQQSYFLFDQPMELPGDLVAMGDATV